jgi:transcriptional regulator with XRE-family HTH domain
MRLSKLRHPLAVLRHILGQRGIPMGQKQMADLLGCSTITIQKIENGGLRLSERLAWRISHETGVARDWLLKGLPVPPPTLYAGPYTRETYEKFRSRKTPSHKVIDQLMLPAYIILCHAKLRSIAESAHKRSADFQLFRYKLDIALGELASVFGETPAINRMDPSEVVLSDLKESESSSLSIVDIAKRVFADLQTIGQPSKRSSTARRRKSKA